MKKLNNNRQAQVKSLDFTNSNPQFLYNQQILQKSPKVLKAIVQGKSNQQKSEITHFQKKTSGAGAHSKGGLNHQLSQVESNQSIKTSPIKSDVIGAKQYPQSITKAATHKPQKIKIGMHKKAVSLMGGTQIPILPFANDPQAQNFLQYNKPGYNDEHHHQHPSQSLKQSYVPSSQTSFNDYSSNHNNNNYGVNELKTFPKVDNFLMSSLDKTGSLLTAQQQQQVKQYQKLLHESALSQQTFDQLTSVQELGLRTFDQRPPLNLPLSQHQSQRLSLASDSTGNHNNNPGYRSHANSFKGSSNNVTMKHAPQKYIKGAGTGTVATAAGSADTTAANLNYSQGGSTGTYNQAKGKKTLQFHHQRTFSDNPASFTNSKTQLFNANATGQIPNRNFQELMKSVNNKDQLVENFMGISLTNNTQDSYPVIMNNTIGQGLYPAKTTIGSSRQSAQSNTLKDERDALLQQYQAHILSQEKVPDINQLYQGQFKEQIMKTKQALKLTQQQFGGPSRKVVQANKFMNGNANTQSYRVQTQQTLAAANLTKTTFNGIIGPPLEKTTPKLSYHKKGKSTSINHSQVGSAQGARTTHNSTQLTNNQQVMYNEKVKKQKSLKKSEVNSHALNTMANINFSQAATTEISLTGVHKAGLTKSLQKGGAGHKRSASDGNAAVFLSLSNRGAQMMAQANPVSAKGLNGYVQALGNTNVQQNDLMRSGAYSQKQSTNNIKQQNMFNANQVVSNEYQIISDRHSYNQSLVQPNFNNPSMKINSHRKIESVGKHQRHNSDQVSMNPEKGQQIQDIQSQRQQILPQQKTNNIIVQKGKSTNLSSSVKTTNEMIIQDQASNINPIGQSSVRLESYKQSGASSPAKLQEIKLNTYYKQGNGAFQQQTPLKPVEERIETQESAISDPNLTPRSRMNVKINKKIKMAFSKPNPTLVTSTEFYKIGKVMGKGAFGKVNLAIHRLSNKFVALKSINKQFLSEEASKRKVMQEFNILRRTRHVNIVRLYESFETTQHIVFFMEVCGAGDLLTYVRRRRKLKEDVAKHMFKQICEGLRYCHSKNILHRDIKLDNILLTSEGDIRICDFGVSKLVKPGEIMTEQCGTPAYIAPEVFENKGYEGYASDVWSSGVVLYAMLYGTVPFKANNMTELQKQITKCLTTFKDEISPEAISLLKGILERDPTKRLKISEILKHPWMQDIPEKISVFTEQEKEKVIQEFAYYNFKADPTGEDGEIVHTDPFTEQMLNSTQNSLVKNASTKSVILAPFNSTRSHIDDNFHLRKSIQELIIDKKNIKFAAKVKEIDRQYEANNNAELDNGVYHQDSDEEEKKAQPSPNGKSLENSFDKDADDEYGLRDQAKGKKQSEWQKLEQMVIDRQKTEEEEEETHQNQRLQLGSAQTLVIDERLISEIEKCGVPKNYIVNCLNNDELNYVTTFYYLLTTQKEY